MKLIPQPHYLHMESGNFRLTYRHRITMDQKCPASVYETAGLLRQEIQAQTGFCLTIDRRSNGGYPGIRLSVDDTMEPEAYRLTVSGQGIAVSGGDGAGILYGVQTLRQILRQSGGLIPFVTIQDAPDLKARGMFYDVTRGRIPTMEFLKGLVDKCSFYKLNQLHLYIEHSFLFEGLSEVWRDDTPLTAEDILELDAYCCKRHVELVPSVATLGHLYKVLRGNCYHHLSELEEGDAEFSFYGRMEHHTLDVNQEESLQLVYRMIDEYASLFTSKLFNINGDEVFDMGKGRGKAKAEEVGVHRMYVDWVKKICAHVQAKGLRPMFWGDVIVEDPSYMAELPENIICMNWDYDPNFREDHAAKLAATGVTQYLCPGIQGWNQMIDRFDIAYRNLHKMATLAHKYKGEGLLVTQWGDYGHMQDPESAAPGIAYAGAMAWNREIPAQEELNEAVSVIEYGDPSGSVMAVLRELSEQAVMTWGEIVVYSEISRGRLRNRTLEEFRNTYGLGIRERMETVRERQAAIDRCQETLARLMPTMNERKRMMPYFLMSDGQKLLNRFVLWLSGEKEDAGTLAGELESWYLHYKNRWHETSRESELYRLGEVIFWMADQLRTKT